MAEMLLINPRRRRRAAPAVKRRRVRRVRRRNPVTVVRAAPVTRRRRRRSNPLAVSYRSRRRARRTSVVRSRSRRRRNPIGSGGGTSIMAMLKGAAIGGAGAIGVDLLMGQVNKFIPASMQKTPGKVGVYEVLKLGVTIAAGRMLSRPTRGLSQRMAQGSLVVQMHQLLSSVMPVGSMPLGYFSPASVANMRTRVGPNGINRYTAPGQTPLLSRYTQPGMNSPLLNSARERENVSQYR